MIKELLCAVSATVMGAFSPAIDWGLGHNGQGVSPTPPPGSVQLLEQNNGLYKQDTEEKRVFLTFDLGYEAGFTHEVLDILAKNKIKAIFFLCSHYLQETALVERMIGDGHLIGNHTDKHKNLPNLSTEAIVTDIVDFQTKFTTQYPDAPAPVWFRPPQGRICERSIGVAKDQKLKTMMWSIAIRDWGKEPIDATSNAERITKRIHPGAIILLHITNAGTPKMLEQLLPMLKDAGYEVASHDKL